jgi:hypothetical protein
MPRGSVGCVVLPVDQILQIGSRHGGPAQNSAHISTRRKERTRAGGIVRQSNVRSLLEDPVRLFVVTVIAAAVVAAAATGAAAVAATARAFRL